MPISNETRVRVEFFWKIIASAWPSSGASSSARLSASPCARLAAMRFIQDGAHVRFRERRDIEEMLDDRRVHAPASPFARPARVDRIDELG